MIIKKKKIQLKNSKCVDLLKILFYFLALPNADLSTCLRISVSQVIKKQPCGCSVPIFKACFDITMTSL